MALGIKMRYLGQPKMEYESKPTPSKDRYDKLMKKVPKANWTADDEQFIVEFERQGNKRQRMNIPKPVYDENGELTRVFPMDNKGNYLTKVTAKINGASYVFKPTGGKKKGKHWVEKPDYLCRIPEADAQKLLRTFDGFVLYEEVKEEHEQDNRVGQLEKEMADLRAQNKELMEILQQKTEPQKKPE